MGATQVGQNSTARRTFTLRDSAGDRVAPDGASPQSPFIEEIHLNGAVDTSIVATIDQLIDDATSPGTPIVGLYEVSFPTNYAGVATNDLVAISIAASLSGTVRNATLEFIIDQVSEKQPFIDVS
jgi:hypothetical protein